jgi:GxxExxY protein
LERGTAETESMDLGERLNQITDQIIGAVVRVYAALGPGLLESAYETCPEYELVQAGLRVDRQLPLPIVYREVRLDCGYRLDLLVEDQVVVEAKSVSEIAPIHEAPVISHLRLTGCKVGLLLNFDVRRLREGIRRFVNDFPDPLRLSALSAVVCPHKEET